MKQIIVVMTLITLLFTGCGGGSDSAKSATTGQAQGVFSGTSSNGRSYDTIILPDDTFYALYGTSDGNSLVVSGLITGHGKSDSGSFTSSVTDFYSSGQAIGGTIAASYVTGASISGTLTESGSSNLSFNGATLPSSVFIYSQAASLTSISGEWTGALLDGSSAAVSIDSGGVVSGSSAGCSFSGTITPDSSGKNFFRVSFTYGGSPCLAPNQTQTGIAVYILTADAISHELVAGISSGTSAGSVFFATR